MKKLLLLLLLASPVYLLAQSKTNTITQAQWKDQLYVLDNKIIKKQELENVNPANVVDIMVLNAVGGKAVYGDAGAKGAVIVITKKFAVSGYQEKFSALSDDYESYLTSHGKDDKQFIYMINNVPVPKDKNEAITLYKLPTEKIESVVFIQDQPEGSKILAKIAITTKK